MLSPRITYSHKFNQSGVDLTNLYKLRNAHQDAREGVMTNKRRYGGVLANLVPRAARCTGADDDVALLYSVLEGVI